jgi:hypothetical protein
MVEYLRAGLWYRSNVDAHTLQGLVDGGQQSAHTDSSRPVWIVPPAHHQEPQPPEGYVVSFIRLHERGFNAPASKFMRGLCYHYGVELHNFAPNSISQAATFVGICEGFLSIPVSWDLWLHLFRGDLFTAGKGRGKRWPIHVGRLMFALWSRGFGVYPPCNMTTNISEWDKAWLYLRNEGVSLPPYIGKVLDSRPYNWAFGESDEARLAKLTAYMKALKALRDARLTAAAVLAQCHLRRVIPLMEKALHIYEMAEGADPDALARSRLLAEPFTSVYASQRAKCAVDTKKMVCEPDEVLWSPRMRPDDRHMELLRNFCQPRLFSIYL